GVVRRVDGCTAVSARRRPTIEKNRPKWGAVLMIAVVAAWVGGWGTPASAQKAFVEVTGQTKCYDPSTAAEINCSLPAATGQDGEIQAGVQFPAGRFRGNGNGTGKDNLTNLIWREKANCSSASPAASGTAP